MRAPQSAATDNHTPYVSIACRMRAHAQCPDAHPVERYVPRGVTYEVCTCMCHGAGRPAPDLKEDG